MKKTEKNKANKSLHPTYSSCAARFSGRLNHSQQSKVSRHYPPVSFTFAKKMDGYADIIASIDIAFSGESGPARCLNPTHCDECEEADKLLLNLDPCDLNFDDLYSERCNWIFSFITIEGLRWLFPAMVRVAMVQNPPQPYIIFNMVSQRTADTFTDEQWFTILELGDFCSQRGLISRSDLKSIGPNKKQQSEQVAAPDGE